MSEEEDVGVLKRQLADAEQNNVLAAMYGKQLLEKNQELQSRVEVLEQEKHCLSLKLEANMRMEHSLIQELEQLREQQSKQIATLAAQAAQNHNQDLEKNAKKILDLETIIGTQKLELAESEEKVALLNGQLKEALDSLDTFNTLDQSVDDSVGLLQSQVTALTQEKQDMEVQLSSVKATLKTDKYRLEQAEKKLLELESDLEEKECQVTAYCNALEKNKEEMMELKMEIENLKLAEVDPAKKGNSIFAEVEDQRQVVERQLVNYKTNYNILKKQHDLKTQQVAKLKLQVASLLSLSNNRASMEYVSHMEESLASARTQLETYVKRCQELEETQQTMAAEVAEEGSPEGDRTASHLFKDLYVESKKKLSELNKSLHQAQFDKVVLSDRILQFQRKLRQMEAARDASNGEVIRLRVKLDDFTSKKGEKLGSKEVKRVMEKIPGFEKLPPADPDTTTAASQDTKLIKEKLLDPTTMQEVEKHVKNIKVESIQEKTGNEENMPPVVPGTKKKPKKTVQLTEVVTVQGSDGQLEETNIKKEDGMGKAERKQKVLRKMECPITTVSSSEVEECKVQ